MNAWQTLSSGSHEVSSHRVASVPQQLVQDQAVVEVAKAAAVGCFWGAANVQERLI